MRILVAEDETIIRLDLREILERAGFEVCAEARDGEEAVELADSEKPDLAILDVKMPRLDGIEAARRILTERPIPIVILTAYGQHDSSASRRGRRLRLPRQAVPRDGSATRHHGGAGAPRRAAGAARGGGVPRRGARDAQDRRAGEGAAHGAGRPIGAGRVRAAAPSQPGLGEVDARCRRGAHRHVRRLPKALGPASQRRVEIERAAIAAGRRPCTRVGAPGWTRRTTNSAIARASAGVAPSRIAVLSFDWSA